MTAEIRRIINSTTAVLPTIMLVLILSRLVAAAPDNSVKSLRLGTHENFSRLVLTMTQEPRISVSHIDDHRLLLELGDVRWLHLENLDEIEDVRVKKLAISRQGDKVNGLEVTLARPLGDIRSFWWAEASKLGLDMYLLAGTEEHANEIPAAEPQTDKVIEAVRLGTHQEFSRIVIEFNEKTSYQLRRSSKEKLMLQIHGADLAENFTPTKLNDLRVREMTIASKDQKNVSFRIELETPADRLEHFWWDAKKRLVVDIYGAIGKDERDQTEVSQQVKTNQATTGSDSADTLQAIEPDKVVPSAPNTEPKVVKGDQRGGSSSEQVASSDKEGTSDAGITSVSPTVTKFSKGREGSSADTPEAVLEALIPSLAPEATDLLRRILNATREKRADRALELVARYEEQYQDRAIEPLMLLRADLHVELGLQGVSGSFAKAVTTYRDSNVLGGKSPLQPWALVQLGRIQFRRKHYLEALGYLDLVISKHQQSPLRATALIHRGRLYLERNRADLALDDFQQILSDYPESSRIDEALMGKAICVSLRGEYHQAEALFAELKKRIPNLYQKHPEILYYWGRNDLFLERYGQGRRKLFLALNVGQQPQDSAVLLAHIGDSFRGEGNPERAASYYRLTMKLFPGSDGAIVGQARLAEESGNLELMEEIVREHPKSEMAEFALVKMAAYFHEKENYREAIRMLAQLERGYPGSSLKKEGRRLLRRSLQKRVEQLRSQGNYWELLALLKTVEPWLSDTYRLKTGLWEADAYAKLSLYDDALAVLESITPDGLEEGDRFQWTLLLAQTYESKGKLVLAESLLRRMAITAGGRLAAKVKWQLAELHQKAGNHEEGVATYRELLQEESVEISQVKVLMALAKSLKALEQYSEAKDVYQRVLSLSPDRSQRQNWRAAVWTELGEIHYLEGSFKLAARAYEKALQHGEFSSQAESIQLRSRLATCYEKLGAKAEAKRLYQRIEKEAGELWGQMAAVSQKVQELQIKISEVKLPEG